MDYALADLPLQILRQGRLYIAYSRHLDISTTGKSEKQAVDRFGDLVRVFVREVIERETVKKGSLNDALLSRGWTQRKKRWQPPPSLKPDSAGTESSAVSHGSRG